MKSSMLMWNYNINNDRYASLWALDSNGVPCFELESVWAKTKFKCILLLLSRCYRHNIMSYFFGIRKVRSNGLNKKEKTILRSYNYVEGNPFE